MGARAISLLSAMRLIACVVFLVGAACASTLDGLEHNLRVSPDLYYDPGTAFGCRGSVEHLLQAIKQTHSVVIFIAVQDVDLSDRDARGVAAHIHNTLGVGHDDTKEGAVLYIAPKQRKWGLSLGKMLTPHEDGITRALLRALALDKCGSLEDFCRAVDRALRPPPPPPPPTTHCVEEEEEDEEWDTGEFVWQYVVTIIGSAVLIWLVCVIFALACCVTEEEEEEPARPAPPAEPAPVQETVTRVYHHHHHDYYGFPRHRSAHRCSEPRHSDKDHTPTQSSGVFSSRSSHSSFGENKSSSGWSHSLFGGGYPSSNTGGGKSFSSTGGSW